MDRDNVLKRGQGCSLQALADIQPEGYRIILSAEPNRREEALGDGPRTFRVSPQATRPIHTQIIPGRCGQISFLPSDLLCHVSHRTVRHPRLMSCSMIHRLRGTPRALCSPRPADTHHRVSAAWPPMPPLSGWPDQGAAFPALPPLHSPFRAAAFPLELALKQQMKGDARDIVVFKIKILVTFGCETRLRDALMRAQHRRADSWGLAAMLPSGKDGRGLGGKHFSVSNVSPLWTSAVCVDSISRISHEIFEGEI